MFSHASAESVFARLIATSSGTPVGPAQNAIACVGRLAQDDSVLVFALNQSTKRSAWKFFISARNAGVNICPLA